MIYSTLFEYLLDDLMNDLKVVIMGTLILKYCTHIYLHEMNDTSVLES